MSVFVDIVNEDSFYENLTLGVMKLLEANSCIKNVQLERRNGCDRAAVSSWEQKYCCLLTEDLRHFYTSTDGFLLTWSLEIAGEEFPIGRMEINPLSNLKRSIDVPVCTSNVSGGTENDGNGSNNSVGGCGGGGSGSGEGNRDCCGNDNGSSKSTMTTATTTTAAITTAITTTTTTATTTTSSSSSSSSSSNSNSNSKYANSANLIQGQESKSPPVEPCFGDPRCKLFEFHQCGDYRVFLVYQINPDQDEPSFWLYNTPSNQWYHLADSFSRYFRIMLVHLGLPLWQVCAVGLQLPTWLEQIYMLVGPHLLKTSVHQPEKPTSISRDPNLWDNDLTNVLDLTIFRTKDNQQPTGTKQKSGGSSAATSSSTSGNGRKKTSSSSYH